MHPHDLGMTQTLLQSLAEAMFPPGYYCILISMTLWWLASVQLVTTNQVE